MAESNRRIVILGKTGAGKSSLANTIFREELFNTSHSLQSETKKCQAETRSVNGRDITLIDTPGFFDTDKSEEELKPAIVRCITECAPGPHAFLIVLKVEKFTEHEESVINKINEYFSEEALKYAIVLFTHGDQLPEGETVENLVDQNKSMSALVKKCRGHCHVIDNKYWNKKPMNQYRSNKYQVEELLKSVDKTFEANKGGCYTNEVLQAVEKEIQREMERIRKSSRNMPKEEIRKQAKGRVSDGLVITLAAAGVAAGALLATVTGGAAVVATIVVVGAVAALAALWR